MRKTTRESKTVTDPIDQVLHGYRHGHQELAASTRLSETDSELVTRLSDLSGSLAGIAEFDSYVTAYPLLSGKYYAIGKTWQDEEAPRAGCLLTHTLLVPMHLWK
jgi:hypothetical protein